MRPWRRSQSRCCRQRLILLYLLLLLRQLLLSDKVIVSSIVIFLVRDHMWHFVPILNAFEALQLPRFLEDLRIEIDLHRQNKLVIIEMTQEVSEACRGV